MAEKGLPNMHAPVLAHINSCGDLGGEQWFEVVFHDGKQWCSYAGSDTFDDGEVVKNWIYAEKCFPETNSGML